jgi:multisubunit Na+/H+ antiporter MnhF subunit
MSFDLPLPVVYIALATLSVSLLLCLYRLIIGPTIFDRALALDVMSFVAIAGIAIFSMQMHCMHYFPVILVFAALGFFGLVAIAKFLLRGDIVDRDS